MVCGDPRALVMRAGPAVAKHGRSRLTCTGSGGSSPRRGTRPDDADQPGNTFPSRNGGAVPIRPFPAHPVERIIPPTFDDVEAALCEASVRFYVAHRAGGDTRELMAVIDDLLATRQLITDCWHAHHARMCS
jgi:hypothetical protein